VYVLGLNSYLHDSAAALYHDGRLVFAAEEERLSRVKKDARFPARAINAALEYAGIGADDLSAVAFGWERAALTPLHTLRCTLTGALPFDGRHLVAGATTIARELHDGNGVRRLRQHLGPIRAPIHFIGHHEAHAWSAYGLSGFDDALVLVMDGRGASQSTTLYHARGDVLRAVKTFAYPNSLGAFYEAFTDVLGFERHNDEWKVMGLAAYGIPNVDLGRALRVVPGGYRLSAALVCGSFFNDLTRMIAEYGPRRNPERSISQADMDLAASAQLALEQAVFELVREGVRLTGSRRLCLAGGVAMNSKANGRLLASGLIDEIFVQPAATDDGTAIGAAIAAHGKLGVDLPRYRLDDVYLGPEFDQAEIDRTLTTYKLRSERMPNVAQITARALAEGKIVGWFQGRMEFGPRALGNRSILADPRRVEMRDRVNEVVKFREAWRPFAPSVVEEAAGEYFDGCVDAPYMIVTFDVRPEKRPVIPAVTHADNTARVQTVSRRTNPRYWELIDAFGRITGVPVLMNTSFNLKGEPIVCTPKDAIRTFYSSGLDVLVLGDRLVTKDPSWSAADDPQNASPRAEFAPV
jgi:carbamoyltransferase